MSEDIKTAVIAEKDMPANEAEKNVSPESIKASKTDKRLEKLTALKEKYEKAFSVQAEATRKADSINAQIAKIEKEIQTEEIAEITRLCGEKNVSYKEVAFLLQNIPDGKNADYVVKLLNERSNVI